MNPFAEKYKTLSNARLLVIRDNPQNYQPLALEAAQTELEGRALNEAELADAAAELKAEAAEEKAIVEKREQVSNRLKTAATAIARIFRPRQSIATRMGRLIFFIGVVQAAIGLKLLRDGIVGVIIARHIAQSWPMTISVLSLFLGLFSLVATYLFLRGKTIGWILLSPYLVFINLALLASVVLIMVQVMHYSLSAGRTLASAWIVIAETVLCTPCTWTVYKKWMRELYEIDKFWMISTACIGFLCALAVFMRIGT